MNKRPVQIEIIEDTMAEVLRRKTGAERLAIGDTLYISARQLIECSVRENHSEWTEDQIRREVSRRIAGDAN